MRKITILMMTACVLALAPAAGFCADMNDDAEVIKRAVKSNPYYQKGKEIKWFKLEVTDIRTNKAEVKITLPISLLEMFMESCSDRDLRVDREDMDLDLKEIFQNLKEAGPMSLIEIYDGEEGHKVKIWLE